MIPNISLNDGTTIPQLGFGRLDLVRRHGSGHGIGLFWFVPLPLDVCLRGGQVKPVGVRCSPLETAEVFSAPPSLPASWNL